MTALAHRQPAPSAREADLARSSGQRLARLISKDRPLTLKVTDGDQEQPIELPRGAVMLLMDILESMAAGRGITLMPENAELTTVQAADVLNVSRPFLIKLLKEKALPSRRVGAHRRIRMDDVMAYKAQIDADREAVLDRLVAEAQQHDMGYGNG
jgi:excisionase family DNA binding protein